MASVPYKHCALGGEGCTRNRGQVWYCVDCTSPLCDSCWPLIWPHAEGRTGRDGVPHEKVKHEIYQKLKNILDPSYTAPELEDLHRRDLDTTWFGIRKDSQGRPHLADYDAYTSLLGRPLGTGKERFPQLVSFLGQTNAGKSTLIKMLIQLHDLQGDAAGENAFPSPIVGLPRLRPQENAARPHIPLEHIPTSADVHLYADPARYAKRTPLLYADCEGLEGGEQLPIGAVENRTSLFNAESTIARLTPGRLRPLNWADTGKKKRTRSFFVKQLYPRILYTLSDVVVFVMPDVNSRTFEDTTLRPLLSWAETSLETSVNQPALPHAIIVLNGTDPSSSSEVWDTAQATQSLLDANDHCLDPEIGPHFFTGLAARWRRKGKRIDKILDLIRCYYSSFKVVRIPRKGRYRLLHNQIHALHGIITTSCKASFESKARANMLAKSHELKTYFQSAFDHFAATLDIPFNFIAVSLLNNPIPNDFGGHILQLAIAIQSRNHLAKAPWIFQKLLPLVASSISLDCIRHRKGLPENIFVHYEKFCRKAIDVFWHQHLLCEYKNGSDRCVNVAANHDPKGHQNSRGRVIEDGEFVSSIHPEDFYPTWRHDMIKEIQSINSDLQFGLRRNEGLSQEACLLRIHGEIMDLFFNGVGSAGQFLSHATCFCCLMQAPQHVLRCGHVLCTQCVRSYGNPLDENSHTGSVILLDFCPLHPEETKGQAPNIIRFKPAHAGVRVLCLDGGGMRGIVELEVLRAIQSQLGYHTPVQAFFDLIVGTSTGGIIALAFGVKNWTIKRCIQKFRALCSQAFRGRLIRAIPVVKYIITLKLASKYKTKPLRRILESSFGQQTLFGNHGRRRANHSAKIAVTATDEAGTKAVMIANYSRKNDDYVEQRPGEYEFLRPDRPELELKVWEAAAATSAAPSYFKPFAHEATKRTYLDGAIYHNNPVRLANRERRLLWPDVADREPDIFLSIGTSQNKRDLWNQLRQPASNDRDSNPLQTMSSRKTAGDAHKGTFPRMRQLFTTMQNRIDSILDAERAWSDFYRDLNDVRSPPNGTSRYIRINPDLGRDPPNMDDVSKFRKLQLDAREQLQSRESRAQIARVAHMLVASSFYFERVDEPRLLSDGTYVCDGHICCRFEDGSPYLRGLGNYFLSQQRGNFVPFFEIESDLNAAPDFRIHVDTSVMRESALFRVTTPPIRTRHQDSVITISLHLRNDDLPLSKYSISGFPRALMADDRNKIPARRDDPSSLMSPTLSRSELPTSINVPELDTTPRQPTQAQRSTSEYIPPSVAADETSSRNERRRRSTGTMASEVFRSRSSMSRLSTAASKTFLRGERSTSGQEDKSAPPAPSPTASTELNGGENSTTGRQPHRQSTKGRNSRVPVRSNTTNRSRESSPQRLHRTRSQANSGERRRSPVSPARPPTARRRSKSRRIYDGEDDEDELRSMIDAKFKAKDREIELEHQRAKEERRLHEERTQASRSRTTTHERLDSLPNRAQGQQEHASSSAGNSRTDPNPRYAPRDTGKPNAMSRPSHAHVLRQNAVQNHTSDTSTEHSITPIPVLKATASAQTSDTSSSPLTALDYGVDSFSALFSDDGMSECSAAAMSCLGRRPD